MTRIWLALVPCVALVGPAHAHVGQGAHFTALEGFLHPLMGLDHLTAMLAVGLWSAQGGGRRLLVWPLAFVAAMLVGGIAGKSGVAIPFVEPAIAGSLVIFGLLVVLAMQAPTVVGAALIGLFAFAHGHAHGTEAPALGWAGYAAGFVMATVLIHAVGIALGRMGERLAGAVPVRALGLVPVAIGAAALIR